MKKRIFSALLLLSIAGSMCNAAALTARNKDKGQTPVGATKITITTKTRSDSDKESVKELKRNSILLAINSPIYYLRGEKKQIDDSNVAVTPIISNSRTLVPVRFLAESLGMKVQWDGASKTAEFRSDTQTIKITIGKSVMYVNGEAKALDTPAEIREGHTLVPLRAISEALGKKVNYSDGLIIVWLEDAEINTQNKRINQWLEEIKAELFPAQQPESVTTPTTSVPSSAVSDKYAVTFSADIAEVNGVAYASRDVPGLKKLPVNDHGLLIFEFTAYDGYVYYSLTTGGTSDFDVYLYRCKTDFTGEELLDTMLSADWEYCLPVPSFQIVNGVLYYRGTSPRSLNLTTMQLGNEKMPTVNITDNGKVYAFSHNDDPYAIRVYADQYVFIKTTKSANSKYKLYLVGKDENTLLYSSSDYTGFEGGIACGYLYFITSGKNMTTMLHRVPLSGGAVEKIDSSTGAGGKGYFSY